MKPVTNHSVSSYKDLWQYIFPHHYQDKYQHKSGLSGGGGNYPFYDIHIKDGIFLQPHTFALGSSIEYFNVPNDFYLKTGNKSSIARQGVDASFNTYIDNGFKGFLTIEIVNHSNKTIICEAGQPILKVEAIKCLFQSSPYDGKYQNQKDEPVSAILN